MNTTDTNAVWEAFDGICPDCCEDLPLDVEEGQECAHCGYLLCIPEEDDGQPTELEEWLDFDPDC